MDTRQDNAAGRDPTIAPNDDRVTIVTLQANGNMHVLVSVVYRPNHASWANNGIVTDLNFTASIQLRIRTNSNISTQTQSRRKINYYTSKHTTSSLSLV